MAMEDVERQHTQFEEPCFASYLMIAQPWRTTSKRPAGLTAKRSSEGTTNSTGAREATAPHVKVKGNSTVAERAGTNGVSARFSLPVAATCAHPVESLRGVHQSTVVRAAARVADDEEGEGLRAGSLQRSGTTHE
jgi:hypothetical protein